MGISLLFSGRILCYTKDMSIEVIQGDCLEKMRELDKDSVDLICTDPPYGYSFMGKDWDKAVVSVEIWKECLRVLKPGAFALIMSAPRQDVLGKMISNLTDAGFKTDFTSIYWTYASGFPKAGNIGKMVQKRLGVEETEIDESFLRRNPASDHKDDYQDTHGNPSFKDGVEGAKRIKATSPQAKVLDGSYAGYQPKPAVEVILVVMKPLSEKTYVDQALKNRKGITWLDSVRVPTEEKIKSAGHIRKGNVVGDERTPVAAGQFGDGAFVAGVDLTKGRFPANLIVSDDVLNDGVVRKSGKSEANYESSQNDNPTHITHNIKSGVHFGDSGSYSRYFSLDKWADTLPFLICPKASKSEKNEGCEGLEEKSPVFGNSKGDGFGRGISSTRQDVLRVNHHPTCKPLKLMSYLIQLGSREGDMILDPFLGSGTTLIACKNLRRNGIGIEMEKEYCEIAGARVRAVTDRLL